MNTKGCHRTSNPRLVGYIILLEGGKNAPYKDAELIDSRLFAVVCRAEEPDPQPECLGARVGRDPNASDECCRETEPATADSSRVMFESRSSGDVS